MKHTLLVVCLFSYVCTIRGLLFASNSSDPVWKQLEALEHVHTFLVEVQQEIKESRDLLKQMNNGLSLNYTKDAPPKLTTKKTLERDLLRYLSPNAPKSLLRIDIGSTSTNPTSASVVKIPEIQQQTQMSFLMAHDYLLPDLAPNYRDIFAPEPNRQGDANEQHLTSTPWTSNSVMIPTATTIGPSANEDPKNTNELHMLYTQTTKIFSVGDILEGLVLETTTPEAHPVLHNEIVREATGYFSVGVENLLMLVVTKDPDHVRAVLEPAYLVVGSLETTNNPANLHWLGYPMTSILHSTIASLAPGGTDIDEIQTKANLLWTLLKNRRAMLGDEANRILDFADGMVNEEDGERIFDRLDDFLHFPNVSTELLRPHYKTGQELCKALIEAFNYPFAYKTVDRLRLVNSANAALRDHFGDEYTEHRRAGFWPKLNSWFASYDNPNTRRGHKFSQTSLRSRGSRISMTHRRSTRQRSVQRYNKWTRTYSQSVYNRAWSIGKLKNNYFLKQQSNRNKRSTYKFRTTEKRFNKRFSRDAKKSTTKPMISRNSIFQRTMDDAENTNEDYKKNIKRTQSRVKKVTTSPKLDEPPEKKPDLFSKWITSHTESYPDKYLSSHRRPNKFKRQNDKTPQDDLEEYPKQLKSNIKLAVTSSKPRLKDKTDTNTAEIQSEYTMDSDNLNSSSIYSDEKEILDVNLLNRLLNVTAEESLENNKPLNVSIETDDDIEILKHLKEVLYDK